MARKTLEDLNSLLIENYSLYLKTQVYHWNVTGSNFYSLHLLFEAQYKDLAETNDVIAERIRALNEKVDVSMAIFAASKKCPDPILQANSTEMLQDLIADHENLTALLASLAETAANEEDKATEDLAIERIREHEKQIWFLKSNLSLLT